MQQEIKVFQREIDDGVAEVVRSQASVAYCSSPSIIQSELVENSLVNKIKAENKGQVDLYYLESILVSTNWNGNDDVFLPGPTWAARNTPEDKQFNFMHNENDIIGHITGSYVIDRQGNRVEANSDDSHPDDFDIVTRVVLYTSWAEEENRERMQQIITDLQGKDSKWFVSMECLFGGFNYAVADEAGNHKVIIRDEESSFLTKHLRSYGGTGTYEGFRVGRALNNISFSGEGLVDNPANKKSIILGGNETVAFTAAKQFTIGETNMSDSVKEQLDSLKAELAEAKTENKAIKAKMEEVKNQEIQAKIEAHEVVIAEKDAVIAELTTSVADLEAELLKVKEDLKASEESYDNFKKKDEERKKKEKKEKREAALIAAGVSTDKAVDTVASLDSLDDDAFASIVELYESKQAEASSDEDGEAVAEDNSDEDGSAEADALEDVETDEVVLAGDSSEDIDSTRAEIAEFISNAMSK